MRETIDKFRQDKQETQEDTAKEKLDKLLSTSFREMWESGRIKGENPVEVLPYIEEVVAEILASDDSEAAIIELRSLVDKIIKCEDKKPRIFNATIADWKQMPYGSKWNEDDYDSDIMHCRSSSGYLSDEELRHSTYRSFYLAAIIKAIGKSGAGEEIIRILANINSHEIDEQHEQEAERKQESKDIIYFETEERWQETEIQAVSRKEDIAPYYDWVVDYDVASEFNLPKMEAIIALAGLEKVDEKIIRFVLDWMKKDSQNYRIQFNTVIDILNKNPLVAGELLMELIKEESNSYLKSLATRTLYQLELGKIGMSEQGVNYLDKVFDLGDDNHLGHFAHRATGSGQVAVFGENRQALGFFQLNNLDSPENKIKAELLEFTCDTLFNAKPNETPEDRVEREKILEEFKRKYFDTYITDFYDQTGVRFNNLDFREQGWFLWYAQQAAEEDKQRAIKFIKQYRENGFRTFLALEHDRAAGKQILDIGEKLSSTAAMEIFKKYGELADAAASAVEHAQNLLTHQADDDTLTNLKDNLLSRGRYLIGRLASQLPDSKDEQEKVDALLKNLSRVESGQILLGAVFESLGKMKKIEDIVGLNLDIIKQDDFAYDEELKERLLNLAEDRNQNDFGEKVVLPSLRRAMMSPKNTFFVLRKENAVLGFMRFEQLDKNELYFGSFNMSENLEQSGFGTAIMDRTIDAEAKQGKRIVANVAAENPIAAHYINKRGFVISKILPDVAGTGVLGFEIVRDDAMKKEISDTMEYSSIAELQKDAQDRVNNGEVIVKYKFDKSRKIYIVTFALQVVMAKEAAQPALAAEY